MKFLLNQIKLIKFKSLVVQVQRKGTQITTRAALHDRLEDNMRREAQSALMHMSSVT